MKLSTGVFFMCTYANIPSAWKGFPAICTNGLALRYRRLCGNYNGAKPAAR